MNKAFLSHSSAQKDFVRKVYKLLGASRCVFDECCFDNGKKIIDEILRGLQNTDLFILFVSNESLDSDWVQQEIVLADMFMQKHGLKQILPILIDPKIKPGLDDRIPNWMKQYLMKPIQTPEMVKLKILSALRHLDMETNSIYKAKRNLFVGRYKEKEELEGILNLYVEPHYNAICVSGLEGIGRRTFLRKFFEEKHILNTSNEPILLSLNNRSSIDNLILSLLKYKKDVISSDDLEELDSKSITEKTTVLQNLFKSLANENEYIFIIDDGCVVRPTMEVSNWFVKAIDIPENHDCFYISVISRFRPSHRFLSNHDDFISISIDALSVPEVRNLFFGYGKALGISSSSKYNEILSTLNGIPSQVYYAVEYIRRFGIDVTLRNKGIILDYGDKPVMSIIADIKERGEESFSLLVLLSKLQTTSYDMIYNLVGNTDFVNQELEFFYVSGVFSLFGENKEYIEVHYSIADYIRRSRVDIKPEYRQKLNDSVEEFVDRQASNILFTDLSQMYHDIRGAIMAGKEISSKYYLPSFTLNAIAELYNNSQYNSVINLVDKMLLKSNQYDENTIREYRYWLCMSLARNKDRRFEKEVQYFYESADYYFLKGFYWRLKKDLRKAEEFLGEALKLNSNHQRTKREIVNVYIMNGNYQEGLTLAKENFMRKKTNPFHIQAYFICLLHNNEQNVESVQEELYMLLDLIQKSLDKKAKSMYTTMLGEYIYYVQNNPLKAIEVLENSVNKYGNVFAFKALGEIYKKEGLKDKYHALKADMTKRDLEQY
mgnify:FL=1